MLQLVSREKRAADERRPFRSTPRSPFCHVYHPTRAIEVTQKLALHSGWHRSKISVEFDTSVHSQNALATGIVVTSLCIASFVGFAAWEEWGNMMTGLWLAVSPWILNFNGSTKWYQVAIGIVIAAFAKNEL
jgi:hypothetical protein